jgi:lipoprotein-releasing system permease protein
MAVWTVAIRWLITRRVALVAALCITATVTAMILITSVMDGFRSRIHGHIRSMEPDLCVRWRGAPPRDLWARVAAELRGEMSLVGGPLEALAPHYESVGVMLAETDGVWRMDGARLVGVDWEHERRVLDLASVIRPHPDSQPNEDLLGHRAMPGLVGGRPLLRTLGASLGAEATLMTGRMEVEGTTEPRFEPASRIFEVTGSLDSGRDELDQRRVLLSRSELLRLRRGPGSSGPDATSVHARLVESARSDAPAIAARLAVDHPLLEVTSWEDRHRGLVDALTVERRVMAIVLACVVAFSAALLGALQLMLVYEKERDVGVLRSMGFTRAQVLALFSLQGGVLGLIGVSLGCWAGVSLVQNLDAVVLSLEDYGLHVFDPAIPYRSRTIPSVLHLDLVASIGVATFLLTLLMSALAALRAVRNDPLKALGCE